MELISRQYIENKIHSIRGLQVMLDGDLAEMYQIPTGRLNEQVKRNKDRFPTWESLRFQFGTSSGHGGRRALSYAFIELAMAILSSLLLNQLKDVR